MDWVLDWVMDWIMGWVMDLALGLQSGWEMPPLPAHRQTRQQLLELMKDLVAGMISPLC
jgi:hypothetical protein